ncbi:hypothetical protein PAXRUDRAFT_9656 [Paxillus rubicundulus Ve08.2h10]|uniref:Uncharacterized protein n=1 Tax=Paxillus rubicundulus Ve08.2h10 TaxID=930991 RepID=A0A0D0DIT5_9AGAM|nr:hypothetical protein PAXRUDRAFT_9656 [Paxillus rubicundulus Ve08.2h10]
MRPPGQRIWVPSKLVVVIKNKTDRTPENRAKQLLASWSVSDSSSSHLSASERETSFPPSTTSSRETIEQAITWIEKCDRVLSRIPALGLLSAERVWVADILARFVIDEDIKQVCGATEGVTKSSSGNVHGSSPVSRIARLCLDTLPPRVATSSRRSPSRGTADLDLADLALRIIAQVENKERSARLGPRVMYRFVVVYLFNVDRYGMIWETTSTAGTTITPPDLREVLKLLVVGRWVDDRYESEAAVLNGIGTRGYAVLSHIVTTQPRQTHEALRRAVIVQWPSAVHDVHAFR